MAYNTKSIVKDVNKRPVPQYFSKSLDKYEVAKGTNGAIGVVLYNSNGNEIIIENGINNIIDALNNLVEVVKDGI